MQELLNGLLARREEGACVLLVFNPSFAFQSLFVGMPGFPLLLGVTVFVNIVINDGISCVILDLRLLSVGCGNVAVPQGVLRSFSFSFSVQLCIVDLQKFFKKPGLIS